MLTEYEKQKARDIADAIIEAMQPHINEPRDAICAYYAINFCARKMHSELKELHSEALDIAKERGLNVE